MVSPASAALYTLACYGLPMNARQALYDAVKTARTGTDAWVTYRGERLRLTAPTDTIAAEQAVQVPAIIRVRRGWGMALALVWWHEGRLHCCTDTYTALRRGNDDIVLAIVVERHPRNVT